MPKQAITANTVDARAHRAMISNEPIGALWNLTGFLAERASHIAARWIVASPNYH
jgi:hypothetical protein